MTSGRSPIQQPELWAAQPQTIRAVQPSLAVKQTLAEMWFSQRLHPPPPPHPPTPHLTPSTYIALTVHYASSPWLEMIYYFFSLGKICFIVLIPWILDDYSSPNHFLDKEFVPLILIPSKKCQHSTSQLSPLHCLSTVMNGDFDFYV